MPEAARGKQQSHPQGAGKIRDTGSAASQEMTGRAGEAVPSMPRGPGMPQPMKVMRLSDPLHIDLVARRPSRRKMAGHTVCPRRSPPRGKTWEITFFPPSSSVAAHSPPASPGPRAGGIRTGLPPAVHPPHGHVRRSALLWRQGDHARNPDSRRAGRAGNDQPGFRRLDEPGFRGAQNLAATGNWPLMRIHLIKFDLLLTISHYLSTHRPRIANRRAGEKRQTAPERNP
ncbi:hypothetical protein C7389_1082 [Azoarcus indigens]|uniref:Uncharacterized protein n=1 Tax=Azoarcus indigens TaxID=29545 RepID=A0A4R6E174_9RHOO|nr:hypothetical protein C7389_1082 [Azoarcus indigens]